MANNQHGERTEKPSAKRVKDARERGQIARSRDLSGAVSLAVVTLALAWFGASMVTAIAMRIATGLTSLADWAHQSVSPMHVIDQLWSDAGLLARVSGPPAVVAGLASVAASVAQVGWGWSPKALEVSWERLSPAQGLAKFKPMQAAPETLKAVFGMTVVGLVAYYLVRDFYVRAPGLMGMSAIESARVGWELLWGLLWRVALALVALGVFDYAFQYWRWFLQLKMTRKDVQDEARQNDGRPEVKSRIRRIQREMARNRMLKAVETATVVVTNPTHFAVALEYRRGEMAAPVVVAKGQDHMAARIREIARKHEVPLVENVSLARALFKSVDIGDAIPADLFGAVAEVLAYLVRLKRVML
jgi:flagellar biosynthetic protein FlhB